MKIYIIDLTMYIYVDVDTNYDTVISILSRF